MANQRLVHLCCRRYREWRIKECVFILQINFILCSNSNCCFFLQVVYDDSLTDALIETLEKLLVEPLPESHEFHAAGRVAFVTMEKRLGHDPFVLLASSVCCCYHFFTVVRRLGFYPVPLDTTFLWIIWKSWHRRTTTLWKGFSGRTCLMLFALTVRNWHASAIMNAPKIWYGKRQNALVF